MAKFALVLLSASLILSGCLPSITIGGAAVLTVINERSGVTEDGRPYVYGKVQNSGGSTAENVSVKVTWYNVEGDVLGETGQGLAPADIPAGEAVGFHIRLEAAQETEHYTGPEDIDRYEVLILN